MLISRNRQLRKKKLKNKECIIIVYFNIPVDTYGDFFIHLHIKVNDMTRKIFGLVSLCAVLATTALFMYSCNEEEPYYDRMVNIKEEIFRQNVKAKTVGGNKATVINTREELVESVGEKLATDDPSFFGINFDNSTLILDSDTIIYKVPTNLPDVRTTYLARGLSGAYSFSYYLETQKADTGNEEQDKITNAKRDFIIGIVVDKLPDGSEVYLGKTLNYIDSTIHGYPTKIGKIKRVH